MRWKSTKKLNPSRSHPSGRCDGFRRDRVWLAHAESLGYSSAKITVNACEIIMHETGGKSIYPATLAVNELQWPLKVQIIIKNYDTCIHIQYELGYPYSVICFDALCLAHARGPSVIQVVFYAKTLLVIVRRKKVFSLSLSLSLNSRLFIFAVFFNRIAITHSVPGSGIV